jgi:hypothetical protein
MAPKAETATSTMGVSAARGRVKLATETDIEDLLVWVYQKQQAHKVEHVGVYGPGWRVVSGDGCARVAEIAALGCAVDGGGYANGTLAEDAEIVHGEVVRLDALDVGLVISHAVAGSRPEHYAGMRPRLGPAMDRGKPIVLWDKHYRYGHCKVQWLLSQETIDLGRYQYVLWWQALDHLARVLKGRLVGHRVGLPAAPAKPWLLTSASE